MKVKITAVHGHGDFKKEHVMLRVLEDCNMRDFVIADNTYTPDEKLSNKVRHTYWFPEKNVKKGDVVVLRTRPNPAARQYELEKHSDGITPKHAFYWGLKEAVWNDTGDVAYLFHSGEPQTFPTKGT